MYIRGLDWDIRDDWDGMWGMGITRAGEVMKVFTAVPLPDHNTCPMKTTKGDSLESRSLSRHSFVSKQSCYWKRRAICSHWVSTEVHVLPRTDAGLVQDWKETLADK